MAARPPARPSRPPITPALRAHSSPDAAKVLLAIAAAVVEVAETLRTASTSETGTSNLLGDKQLVADVAADAKVMAALAACGAVATGSSEEQPSDHALGGQGERGNGEGKRGGQAGRARSDSGRQARPPRRTCSRSCWMLVPYRPPPRHVHTSPPATPMRQSIIAGYSVAWDPLDGSSIIGANWAVGSVFGVWPGDWLVAAAYAVHGPKTVLVLARPVAGADAAAGLVEFMHDPSAGWLLSRGDVRIPSSKKARVFAPANLRASADNEAYRVLVQASVCRLFVYFDTSAWMAERYTLRYSGGMVPDMHHILAKASF
eukprot:scaffold5.g768.t1